MLEDAWVSKNFNPGIASGLPLLKSVRADDPPSTALCIYAVQHAGYKQWVYALLVMI